MSTSDNLDWLLEAFLKRVPHTCAIVLASADGVRRSAAGMSVDDADRMSAGISGLLSMAASLPSTGLSEQLALQHSDGLLFVIPAGMGGVLSVSATLQANSGAVGYELSQLVRSVEGIIGTPERSAS